MLPSPGKVPPPLEPNPGFLSGRATPTSFQVPGLGKDPLQHRKFGGYLEISPTPGLEVCGFGHVERRREARKMVAVVLAIGHALRAHEALP